ncbi:PKD domain-containing protein [Hyalangium rubrum]|uniref:PKD domain-containing protein n=1 Tax=Hyalangium rubrum TaxID=3103134 RepID=A0ABU5HBZ7_9BACT|nr:PKD domain-containing protein [Hyalangium sp. s54d21]MDY7230634.1 PKD domain-containing protein [Hyalangium sp. s54d21]
MSSMTVAARGLALLAVVCLGCNVPGADAVDAPTPSTRKQALDSPQVLNHDSPFRYGHLTWRTVGPRTAEFSIINAFRRVYPGSGPDGLVVTGDTFVEYSGYTTLCFGDNSCSVGLTYEVTRHSVEEDWVIARAITSNQPQRQPGTGVTVLETEPNNTLATANLMQLGDDYFSNIGLSGESDYVRFSLSQRTSLELRTSLVTLRDSYLYLYDSTGLLLAADDDGGGGLNSLITITLDAGTYYIRAAGFSSNTGQQYVQLRVIAALPPRPITHTYASDGPFTASIDGCCRIPTLSNPGSSFRVQTQVRFSPSNSSPVSTLSPVVDAPSNTSGFSFPIPATDAEGDQLSFRLATNDESSLYNPPPGMTVSSTGLVRWNTVGTTPGQLWAVQVIIEERRNGVLIGSSAVDFLVRIATSGGTGPTCVPPSQTSYTLSVGQQVHFTIGTQDPTPGDTLRLSVSGAPSDAFMQPFLPLQGPSGIATHFSWVAPEVAAGLTFPVRFTVTDSLGQSSHCTVSITVESPSNPPPVANAGSDQRVSEGSTVTLDGSGSSDPDGQALTYQWLLLSSTGPEVTLSSPTSTTPSFTASDDGLYTFLLTVTDSEGATDSATVVVYVNNVMPQVSATGGQLDEGEVFTSSGTFTDPGADSWTAMVDYGDNTGWQPLEFANGTFTLSHRYLDDNPWAPPEEDFFQVQILITDDDGAQGTVEVLVNVRNVAPVFVNLPSLETQEGEVLTATLTITDPGTDSWWAWVDWGDGYGESLWIYDGQLPLEHVYGRAGTYPIQITLQDEDGGSTTVELPVVVHNVAPIIVDLSGFHVDEGWYSELRGFFFDPAWDDTFTLTVDWGDGTGEQPMEAWNHEFWNAHLYADSGTYQVTVTVTDSSGGVGTATVPIVVRNVAPWVYATEGYGEEGGPTTLWGYLYDQGYQDTWMATVDWGDGTEPQTLEVFNQTDFDLTHVYANSGWYPVTITVTDDEGGQDSTTTWAYVQNRDPQVTLPEFAESIEGSTVRLEGTFTDPGVESWTGMVDYGDGTDWQPVGLDGKSFTLEHVYANSGWYWVNLYIQDSDGGWGWASMNVRVHNVAPELSPLEGGEIPEGGTFVTSGTFTDVGQESDWSIWVDYGGGGWEPVQREGNGYTLAFTYPEDGVYTVTVMIQDDEATVTTSTQVVVHNVAPVVTAEGGTIDEGTPFYTTFFIFDPATWWDDWSAQIDYGDGSPVETLLDAYGDNLWVYHEYQDSGTYPLTVTITDDEGGVGTRTVLVEVLNVAPSVVDFSQSSEVSEGAVYTAHGQIRDPGQDAWTITADFGDGSEPQPIDPTGYDGTFTASHVYDDNGLYTVTFTITDEDGGTTAHTAQVWVHNVAPTATASHDSPLYWGLPVTLVGTATDPSFADTQAGFTALWTLGDGSTASGLLAAHAYAAPGTYLALVSVADKDGGSTGTGLASTTVTVQQRPGAVTCEGTSTVFGFPAALSARFVDGLPGAQLGGRSLAFRLGASTSLGSASTDNLGLAGVQSPSELSPGSHTITVSFAGDSHYAAAEATCTLTVIQSNGKITGGGLRFANHSRGGFNVMLKNGSPIKGELQFQNDTTSFHARTMTVLGVSADKRQGWFSGLGTDGRAFTAYVEDNGEPGTSDVFKLWIDGALETGEGPILGGNIQIH